MARKRSISVLELEELCSKKGVKFVSRVKNPNYVKVQFNACHHIKDLVITSLRKHNPFCEVCYAADFAKQMEDTGYYVLAKIKGGNQYAKKTRFSQRLVACKTCGYWKIVIASKYPTEMKCRNCMRLKAEELCSSYGFTLIDKVDKEYLKLQHADCGGLLESQMSNLKRGSPRCPHCKPTHRRASVYVIEIKKEKLPPVVKVGKSTNPYKRIVDLTFGNNIEVEFHAQRDFKNEQEALAFEKEIHKSLVDFSLPAETAKTYISNGFTECYDVRCLDTALRCLWV